MVEEVGLGHLHKFILRYEVVIIRLSNVKIKYDRYNEAFITIL
jgi:hypothetical protein